MTEIYSYAVAIIPVLVTGLIALLAVIAPLTKTTWDNTALNFLRWIESTILKVLFPALSTNAGVKTAKDAADEATAKVAKDNDLI